MTRPATATPPATGQATQQWRRLDTRMLLVHPVVELVRAIPALVALLFAGSGSGHGSLWGLAGTAVVIAMAISRWFTTRYRITSQQVELRYGLFRRRTVAAPLDRVRTVDVTAHALHRLLGLAKVVIGTGISDRKGHHPLTLDGLRTAQANRLRAELLHRAPARSAEAPSAREQAILGLNPRWIRYAPFTLSGAVTALAIGGFAWRIQNETQADPNQIGLVHPILRHLHRVSLAAAAGEVALAVAALIVLASMAGYLLAFWNFRLTRHTGGSLHITRGLLTARATSIEERRLQGVELSEPLLLRMVGGARAIAIATGLRVGRGAERGGTMLAPPCPRGEAARVAAEVLGTAEPIRTVVLRHGERAVLRRSSRALASAAILASALGVLAWWDLGGLTWLWVLALLPCALALAADRAGNLGHALVDGYLVTQYGSLLRRRCVLSTQGIIGWNVRSSYFQRQAGLVTLTATTAAGRQAYRVYDLPADDALRLAGTAVPGLLDEFRM